MIFDVYGAVRSGEFTNIKIEDIEDHGNIILVKIPANKTSTPCSFTIKDKMRQIVQKYAAFRSPKTTSNQFFVNYRREKWTKQVIGTHKFEKMPKHIAECLNFENSELCRGHAFWRTSTTFAIKFLATHVIG